MKANRKAIRADDEAVSPVIAVILMVAITVVLAATVYVWVSGFGAQSTSPAKTLALNSAAAYTTSTDTKDYTVSSSTPGLKYKDLTFTLNGVTVTCPGASAPTGGAGAPQYGVSKNGGAGWVDCTNSATIIAAGDLIRLDANAAFTGQTLRVLDTQANSVIFTLVVG